MTDLLGRILVPLDGSELADRILEQVRRLLVRRDGAVTLLRVLTPLALELEKRPGEQLELARLQLERLASALRAQGAQVTCEVAVGEPADRIHVFDLERRPSLIAMSTHGRTGLARWTRGSVAERLLRVARAPLLLANPFCAGKDELRFRRILVPLDGSERSAGILPLVNELASLYESEVLLHMSASVPRLDTMVYPLLVTTDEAQKTLDLFRDRVPGRVQTIPTVGPPAATILEVAEREKVDLVALTTHGRTGAARWAFGSVAEQVIRHAPCPLLVKRTAGPEDQE